MERLDSYEGSIVYANHPDGVHLMSMIMDRNFRGKGYGTKLYQHFESMLQKDTLIYLEVHKDNKRAEQFWEKMGFEIDDWIEYGYFEMYKVVK